MRADAPTVIHVVTFLRQRGDHLDVLRVPVPFCIVLVRIAATAAAIVIQAILQKNPQRLAFALANEIRINVAAANVREATNDADDLVKLIRPLPRDGERADRTRTG